MQKLTTLFILVVSLFSCKNDLKLQAPYKDVTVVYGLLDQNDTTHYIRVNKVFNGAGNAYTMAQQYDSINYPVGTLTIQLQDYSNGNLINTISFSPTTNVPVDSGIFCYPSQIEYYSKAPLNPNDRYSLLITNNKTGKQITGSTMLLQDVYITSPALFLGNGPLGFISTNPDPITIYWQSVAGTRIYQLYMRFYYREIDTVKKDTVHKYLDWVFPACVSSTLDGGEGMSTGYIASGFYELMAQSLKPIAPGVTIKRTMDTAHVVMVSGSDDLNTYLQLSLPSLGINQEKPFYSNIKNAIGLFSARHVQTGRKTITQQTIDSLRYSSITSALNFR